MNQVRDKSMKLTLSYDALNKLSSFWLILSEDLIIMQHSPKFGKLCPEVKTGSHFQQLFELETSPDNSLQIMPDTLYFVHTRSNGNRLKGQFISLDDKNQLFACAPLLSADETIFSFKLDRSDFPLHDYSTDAMELIDANLQSISEIQEFNIQLELRNKELTDKQTQLEKAQQLLATANEALEERVKRRTQELKASKEALEEVIINLEKTQDQLVESEKLSALGQLVAGIAHEINTPIGAIKSAAKIIQSAVINSLSSYHELFTKLDQEKRELFNQLLTEIINNKQVYSSRESRQMKRQQKTILTEAGIENSGDVSTVLSDLEFFGDISRYYSLFQPATTSTVIAAIRDLALQSKMTSLINESIEKADRVITALKSYLDGQGEKEMSDIDIMKSIDNTLTLHRNFIQQGVEVIKDYSESTILFRGYHNELNQVWINIIHNAIQAMECSGRLSISVKNFDDLLFVKIEDNGPGIPIEIQHKIFDPFFTTKAEGQGTGLGLDLVRKIVRKHNGEVNMESEPGKTTFTISLPGVIVNHHYSPTELVTNE